MLFACPLSLSLGLQNNQKMEFIKIVLLHIFSRIGIAEAQNRLGRRYEDGDGINKNLIKAVKWYTKASNLKHAYAQSNLGRMYEHGYGTNQNLDLAIKLYTKAAEQGHTWSQNNLGCLLSAGQYNLPVNYQEAIKWFVKTADLGNANGHMNIAWLYYNGYGVEQDFEIAFEHYNQAREIPQAQYQLGLMYSHGLGTNINNSEAYKLLESAYNSGINEAKTPMNIAKSYALNQKQI